MNHIAKLNRVLDKMGGLYNAQDILDRVELGTMQMFAENDSIAVTQISVYPRARILDVIIAVGDIKELRVLHDRILEFAAKMGIGLVQAHGRSGWVPDAAKRGWRNKSRGFLYQRSL